MLDDFGDWVPDEAPRRNQMPQQGPQPAMFPPVWSQADDIDLQRLLNGASVARQKAMSGEWGQETFASMQSQLDEQAQPLLMRKQASMQYAQQQQTQAALHQNALMQGVRNADMQNAAQAFPMTLHKEYNPDTKGFDTYYQTEPGKWNLQPSQPLTLDPIDVGTEESPAAMGPIGGTDRNSGENQTQAPIAIDGLPYGDQPRFSTFTAPDGSTRQQRIPTLAEHQLVQQAVGASPGRMDITNGPFTDQFQNGRFTSTNRPPPPAPDGSGWYYHQARSAFGPEPPQTIPDRFGRPVINPNWVTYNKEVLIHARQLQAQEFKQRLADQAAAQKEAQAEAKAAAKEKALEPPADLTKLSVGQLGDFALGKGRGHDVVKMIADEEANLAIDASTVPEGTELNGTIYNPKGVTNPGPWKNVAPEDRHTEAMNRVRRRLVGMLGARPGAAKQEAAPAGARSEAKPTAQDELAEALAERARRRKAQEGPSSRRQQWMSGMPGGF